MLSTSRLAITTEHGSRSTLHLVDRANLYYTKRIALPCVAPQIAAHGETLIWLTGAAPPPGPPRCDLFLVDLRTRRVILQTAALDTTAIDVATTRNGANAVLAVDRAIYTTSSGGLREVVEFARDEAVTGIACRSTWAYSSKRSSAASAVIVRSPSSSKLVLLHDRRVDIALPGPGHSPLFDRPSTELL